MDLTDLQTIKSILRKNNLKPKKGFGQNFLVAEKPLMTLIESADITDDDIVVEIGPGLGTLTQELAKYAKLVLAIESDYKMVEWLRKYFKGAKNVKIIHQDILKFSISNFQFPLNDQFSISKPNNRLTSQPVNHYKVVSNLPYNITSPVIRKFLESENRPSEMILMVQKEVAERLCAKPGNRERGILTVMVELFGEAEIVEIVPRSCFYPIPKVDSAIIKIVTNSYEKLLTVTKSYILKQQPIVTDRNQLQLFVTSFMRFVKIGFSQKRRQIHHPLSANLHLPSDKIKDILKSVSIDPTKRAEDLSLDDWIKLYSKIFNL